MRRIILIVATLFVAVSSFSFSPPKDKTAFRMPACYTYGCWSGNCSGLAGWASATGAAMAMYGYTGIHYEDHCCDDACFQTCASMCGTPPDGVPFSEATANEKTVSQSIAGLTKEQARSIGEQAASKAIKEGGALKNIYVSAEGVFMLTYLVKK